jgi:hypothetical protein
MDINLRRKDVIRGIRIFLFLTISGITAVFFLTGNEMTWRVLLNFKIPYLLLAILLVFFDLLAASLKVYILIKRKFPNSFWISVKASLGNMFMAAATPFQTGGGFAQLYVLKHHGVPYSVGFAAGVMNFFATFSTLLLIATLILTALPNSLVQNQHLSMVLGLSRVTFYIILLLFVLFLVKPRIFAKIIKYILRKLAALLPSHRKKFIMLELKFFEFFAQYQSYIQSYFKHEKLMLLLNQFLTLIHYFNKCFIAYVILLGLGISANFWQVVALQMVTLFLIYFAPTPGGSFIAETGMSAMMSLIAPKYALPVFAVLWRFFTTYFGVLLGSIVLLRIIANPGKEKKKLETDNYNFSILNLGE